MEPLLKTKRVLKTRLSRVQSAIDVQQSLSALDALAYVDKINILEDEFNKLLVCISQESDDQQYEGYESEFNDLDSKMHSLKVRLVGTTVPQSSAGSQPSVSSSAELRLPRIELPSFSGKFDQWVTFHDLFVASIHNNASLSGAQKLQYLKSSVKGEAALLIQSFPITNLNYKEAWEVLIQRYQNTREIVSAHLDRLISQSSVSDGSASSLRKLVDTTNECVRAIGVHGVPIDQWDVILVHIVGKLLDSDSRREWELSLDRDSLPKYTQLMYFLDQHAHALSAATSSKCSSHTKVSPKFNRKSKPTLVHHGAVVSKCYNCKGDHSLYKCEAFLKLAVPNREAVIKNLKLCYNCLRTGHQAQQCSSGRCRACNGRHNSLLHVDATLTSDQASVANHHFNKPTHNGLVLLSTALVNIKGADGKWQIFRALLDSGSQASLVTENCVQKLGHRRSRTNVTITGVSAHGVVTSHGSVRLTFSSVQQPSDDFTIDALVLTKITSLQPTANININEYTHYKSLPLADPQFFVPSQIDILLGADIYADLLLSGLCRGPVGSPTALETTLGWVLTGKLNDPAHGSITSHHVHCITEAALNRFWDIEEDVPTKLLTPEEAACEKHFISTHSRDSSGRFIVRLPFHSTSADLGISRDAAVRRFKSVERRYASSPEQWFQYKSFMREYEELGHMKLIPSTEKTPPPNQVFYMPHHAVFKSSSTTTKLRVVFDASAKSSTGVSLNDKLMVGPRVQDDIVPLILRFRSHIIAMTADITKMYRQVNMHPLDTDFQRIVWRENPDQPIQDFRLCTVTYGTSSAPYQATRCLNQLAEDEKTWPLAAAVLTSDFYVDDLLSGASSEHEALELQSHLIQLLSKGGFELRKWSSNSSALLEAVPPHSRETALPLQICKDQSVKALGIVWQPGSDCFSFMVPLLDQTGTVTKRSLLSDLARLYDPLGWLSPTTIKAKLLFQSLWKLDLGWDHPVPTAYRDQWIHYQQELPGIQNINIQRCFALPDSSVYQLHAFSDASERAYATVVYLRTTSSMDQVKTSLIASKTRVAPIKTQSLPRLELCGALLLSRLITLVMKSLNLSCEVHAYTDSTIVLAWLSSTPSRWKTFIANRVSEIQVSLPSAHWHHVSSDHNPADCASRGISPLELLTHELWWSGPDFLHSLDIPVISASSHVPEDLLQLEEKKSVFSLNVSCDLSLLQRYSSLCRLQRITAWCFRYIHNSKTPEHNRVVGPLSTMELQQALLHWVKLVQREQFAADIHQLELGLSLPIKSRLLCLAPFLDTKGLLRVGGRLSRSQLSEDQKHPLLLPHKHILTKLIINHTHITSLHAGPQLMLTVLQKQFWILSGRDAVRDIFRRCVICQRLQATLAQQMMGDLPSARVTPSPPFSHCGVDYAGPFQLRVLKGRGHKTYKGYISLFICFATRAIHLELISDLTTTSFIAGLKRFVARRGRPATIHSDCGTNFVGADRELKQFLRMVRSPDHNNSVSHHLSDQGINWSFNTPAAPHFGGLWEAGIKSVKFHLRRIVGNAILNFEEMTTVLTQIEACLNSRPLSALSSNPSDLSALTPGHFLIGGPLTAIPEQDFLSCKINRLTRWQYSQQLVQHFWKRWSSEYLSRLQRRPKWWKRRDNLKVGELVLIRDETLPPLKWKLGRVTELHTGTDGLVRSVSLKTAFGQLTRPIVKLSPLPMDKDPE